MSRRLLFLALVLLLTACPREEAPLPDGGDGGAFDPGPDPEQVWWLDAGRDAGTDGGTDAGTVAASCAVPCHGSRANAAPPFDTHDAGARSLRTVGAHQAHLGHSTWHRDGQCQDCHRVPATRDDPGHIDPSPAELVWGRTADAGAVVPAWNGDTCTVYCHGPSLSGGRLTQPEWTRTDSAQAYCGDCHGVPPPAPHPQNVGETCAPCHPNAAPGLGFVEPQRHVDGVLDLDVACDFCHGSGGNPAPPVDTQGQTATTVPTVGAHRSHLNPAPTRHALITCDECHVVPATITAPGHLGPSPAELTWGPLARHDGGVPTWNGTTCSNYCHGQTLAGGYATAPRWTVVGRYEATCGSCHGVPPPAPHPTGGRCGDCHGAVIDTTYAFVDPTLHINGQVEVSGACDMCHGSTGNPAPPVDTQGQSSTALRSVGAHQSHLDPAPTRHAPIPCSECHQVPSVMNAPGHLDPSPAELTWGPLARHDGGVPSWDGTTCSNYCHGQNIAGGFRTNPNWTIVNGTQARCGACHGVPPPPPHSTAGQCYVCHGAVINSSGTFVGPTLHVNGRID